MCIVPGKVDRVLAGLYIIFVIIVFSYTQLRLEVEGLFLMLMERFSFSKFTSGILNLTLSSVESNSVFECTSVKSCHHDMV